MDDSEASVTRDFVGFYDMVVFRVVDHADIPRKSTFSCELTIPGTDYRVREQAVYQHNTHGGESTLHLLYLIVGNGQGTKLGVKKS